MLPRSVTITRVPPASVIFGEIGLSGEVRAVGQLDARLKEAAKLGFSRALCPRRRRPQGKGEHLGERVGAIDVSEIALLSDLVEMFGPPTARGGHRGRSDLKTA